MGARAGGYFGLWSRSKKVTATGVAVTICGGLLGTTESGCQFGSAEGHTISKW